MTKTMKLLGDTLMTVSVMPNPARGGSRWLRWLPLPSSCELRSEMNQTMNPIRKVVGVHLLLAAWLVAPCTGLPGEPLPMHSLEPSVMLPDGTEFKTWEQPLRFDRTYYVDQAHPNASDANPGSSERPFATINRAAQILQPGERVVWPPASTGSRCGRRTEVQGRSE